MKKHIHGCNEMKRQLELNCDLHSDQFQCPERLVIYNPRFDEYGMIIHDGGNSYSILRYCPWCGKKFPRSKRDRWFEALKSEGYNDPLKQRIPSKFLTDEWYRSRSKEKHPE